MPEEINPGVYVEEIETRPRIIEGVSTSTVGFVGMTEHIQNDRFDNDDLLNRPTLVTSWRDFVTKFGRYEKNMAPFLPAAVYGFFTNGGKRCFIVRVKENASEAEYVGLDKGPGKRTGLNALNEICEISLVCVPGVTAETVQDEMIDHCQTMGDRICILDSFMDADIDVVREQIARMTSHKGYGALYFPWIKAVVEVIENGQVKTTNIYTPPSGYVAGICARVDSDRGVHNAPANEMVIGALDLKIQITHTEQEVLNPEGINCIRSFSNQGIKVWGARTISSEPTWKYLSVRRFMLFLEKSIARGTQWVVFESNDQRTWVQVKHEISQFLQKVWKNGGLMGSVPEEAFFVKCGRDTMTQNDIDNGRFSVMVGVAPVKPAEFVIFRISQWAGGSQVIE